MILIFVLIWYVVGAAILFVYGRLLDVLLVSAPVLSITERRRGRHWS